jgi:hypothetical protein
MHKNYIGEVVNSSLSQWSTQAWQWDNCPEFGSVVVLESDEVHIFGVVYYIRTGSDDPTRQTFAYQKSEQELRQEQPQIFEFLKTEFSCVPLGYKVGNNFTYAMPMRPPKIHAFVRLATASELAELSSNVGIVQALFSQYTKIDYFEELLLAFIRYLKQYSLVSRQLLLQISEHLSLVTASDYRRLKLFMDRVGSI